MGLRLRASTRSSAPPRGLRPRTTSRSDAPRKETALSYAHRGFWTRPHSNAPSRTTTVIPRLAQDSSRDARRRRACATQRIRLHAWAWKTQRAQRHNNRRNQLTRTDASQYIRQRFTTTTTYNLLRTPAKSFWTVVTTFEPNRGSSLRHTLGSFRHHRTEAPDLVATTHLLRKTLPREVG